MKKIEVTLIGFGAIGQSVFARAQAFNNLAITHIVVPPESLSEVQGLLGGAAQAVSEVQQTTNLVLECAGHSALEAHILPALARGVECAVLSIGAIASGDTLAKLEAAALLGGAKLHLLSGAIGAVDALAAAKLGGLEKVSYTGRKPPQGWRGSKAESLIDLTAITAPTVFFNDTCREAATQFPKNANVAATIALAGLGLDATQAQLIADPTIKENIHEVHAQGAFGEFHLTMRGKPLAENPKTSALTVLSALRFLANQANPITL